MAGTRRRRRKSCFSLCLSLHGVRATRPHDCCYGPDQVLTHLSSSMRQACHEAAWATLRLYSVLSTRPHGAAHMALSTWNSHVAFLAWLLNRIYQPGIHWRFSTGFLNGDYHLVSLISCFASTQSSHRLSQLIISNITLYQLLCNSN